ncbi:MAG: TetR/AcrR family transcriptional regulator [Lachnospiraceae bacterium]|nr:TetR/AcrR family transcriptional regulator [Lachnospiraceae bacterium]
MRNQEKDAREMAARRERMLQTAYRLFCEKNIESVTMAEIAKEAECGNKTLHRYFNEKPVLVVAVSAWAWAKFRNENSKRRPSENTDKWNAFEWFDFYLDSFLELFRNHKDLLKFNQYFNIYVKSEKVKEGILDPYNNTIGNLKGWFHSMYLMAEKDHTIRTDIPEDEIFSTSLHLMLAAITRYAVGLMYIPEGEWNPEDEIKCLKDMILNRYKA